MPEKIDKTLTANKIVAALIDRLISTEKRIDACEKELRQLQEQMAEHCPWLLPTGEVVFRHVLKEDSEDLTEHTVVVKPASVTPDTGR